MAASVHTHHIPRFWPHFGHILATFWPHFPPVTSLTKAYIYYARNLNFEDRPDYAWCRWQFIMILMREAGGAARLKLFFSINGGTPVAGWFNDGKSYEIWSWG